MTRQARLERRIVQLVDRLGLEESARPPHMRQKMYARLSKKYEELSNALLGTGEEQAPCGDAGCDLLRSPSSGSG